MNRREQRKAQREAEYAKELDAWVAEFVDGFGEPSEKQMAVFDRAFREVALKEPRGTEQAPDASNQA